MGSASKCTPLVTSVVCGLVGTIVRRHRVQRPGAVDGQFYTVEDLNLGNELTIYARNFKLVDCDQFTGNFLTKLGVRLNPPQQIPGDPYSEQRKMVTVYTEVLIF